ncbi:MAG TPA: cell division protein FtsZ [Chryseolinea sp.]|nr:cell division protein FtsZ [Chryseolinea sp.]
MFESGSYKFEIPKTLNHRSIIKVVGVGGGGSNAVNHMYKQGIKDVEFIVCNTDNQALNTSPVPNKLQIGANLTEGLGCGANPEVGKNAALESKEQIREMLQDTKMLFVTAGMGGGTGTGAAPVIAKIAKDMDILTVGIVTAPFSFEGRKKMSQAGLGLEALRQNCDTVLVILNDKLREIFGNLSIGQAFAQADNILTTAAKSIAEIITLAGYVNVDFQDVRTVMLNAGAAVMGSAETRGENRARKAAEGALASPLLDSRDIMGAKRILLSIISGEEAELQMDELSEITEYIQDQAGEDAEMIFGHGVDPDLGDRIRVTVIATGFSSDSKVIPSTAKEEKKVHELDRSQGWLFQTDNSVNLNNNFDVRRKEEPPVNVQPLTNPFSFAAPQNTSFVPIPTPPVVNTPPVSTPQATAPTLTPVTPQATPPVAPPTVSTPPATPATQVPPTAEEKPREREFMFTGPFSKPADKPVANNEDDGEPGLFENDDYDPMAERYGDQVIDDDGTMKLRSVQERLELQRMERKERIRQSGKPEVNAKTVAEQWALPAYLRRGVKMQNVPHSSEPFISKFNLNDDNNLLGNNKFLHDNVD